MLKQLFTKAKCFVGFHEGEWIYLSEHACTQKRVCEHCGHISVRVAHEWSDWRFVAAHLCNQVRTCSRCGQTEQRTQHAWGPSEYEREDSCQRVQTCVRCGQQKASDIQHTWGAWQYLSEHSCALVQTCSRCGQERMATAEHCWDRWAYLSAGDCTQAEVCSRCGLKSQNRRIEHDWGEWEYDQASRAPVRVCRRCGEMDVQISQALKVRSLPAAMDGNNGTRRAIPAPCFSDAYDAVESIPYFQTAAPDVEPVSESYQPDYNDPALKFEEESAGWPGGAYQNPDSDYYAPYTYDDEY